MPQITVLLKGLFLLCFAINCLTLTLLFRTLTKGSATVFILQPCGGKQSYPSTLYWWVPASIPPVTSSLPAPLLSIYLLSCKVTPSKKHSIQLAVFGAANIISWMTEEDIFNCNSSWDFLYTYFTFQGPCIIAFKKDPCLKKGLKLIFRVQFLQT